MLVAAVLIPANPVGQVKRTVVLVLEGKVTIAGDRASREVYEA